MGYFISTGTKCLPSQQLYKKSLSKISQWLLPTSADQEKLGRRERERAARGGVSMPSAFQFQCHFVLIFLAASKGETRYLEVRDAGEDEPFLLLSEDLKRELSAGQIYRRSLQCIDMLSIEGQFIFTTEQLQLQYLMAGCSKERNFPVPQIILSPLPKDT
ncbi:corticotropin-releasing factor-binding protein [Limosa lapponica baueri]|uniref:Corticotropin-releasing factor-binding protein n=1 Tax=Limosa lapponica baueri TaxID=1758121 RepID=A0A2I0T1P9_LIMLA|nr:corticotropin-releasing factor-binding protein [Limosa lapponica baueri]